MGREIQPDVWYCVERSETRQQVEDEPGKAEGFSLLLKGCVQKKMCHFQITACVV